MNRNSSVLVTIAGMVGLILWLSNGCTGAHEEDLPVQPATLPGLPDVYDGAGYVSSEACTPCHAAQHETWDRTSHRTMTQVARPGAMAGPFDGVQLSSAGYTYDLRREGDEFWVEYDDPGWNPDGEEPPPRLDRRVIMLTGSHYEQRIWVAGDGATPSTSCRSPTRSTRAAG